MSEQVSSGVAAFVALLAFAALVSIMAERVRIPAAVLLVAVGAAFGSIWHVKPPFAFGPALFFIFLPPLIFEAAWSIDLNALRPSAVRVGLLAVPGTVLSAGVVAVALVAAGALPFGAALLLGAIISATDPVAVIAVFRHAAVPSQVKALVEAESLSNDGVAVVLYAIALSVAQGVGVDWLPTIGHGVVQIVGGVLLGAACSVPLWIVLRTTRSSEYEVTATIVLAYISYLLADHLRLSGIFATAAAAVALRAFLQRRQHMDNRDIVDEFWRSGAYIANATVFLATGLLIDVPRALHEPVLVGVVVGAALLTRAALALAAGRDVAARITIFLAGMRGALPLALALALPENLANRAAIIDGVFAVVLITLVIQGASLEPVVTRLYGKAKPV
ncbi:MAG: cation:proton antiporter [Chloroflexota bacterium]|nr:cation:proton antiporter [Chloroflexota bacterium]